MKDDISRREFAKLSAASAASSRGQSGGKNLPVAMEGGGAYRPTALASITGVNRARPFNVNARGCCPD